MNARNSKWVPVRKGNGTVTGYLEMFWHAPSGQFVTVPGVSRWRNA